MTRRDAFVLLGLSSSALAFRSCQEQQNDLATLTETLGHAMAQLAEGIGNQEKAQRLRESTNQVVALLRAWRPPQDAQEIIRRINGLIDLIQGIEGLDRFTPLVNFALGTLASIIEQLRQAGGGDTPHTAIRLTQAPHTSQEFRGDWDAIRRGSPGLETAPVL